jgi:LAO/AO transport system kinase
MSDRSDDRECAPVDSSDLAGRVLRGDVRAVARLITYLENDRTAVRHELNRLFPRTGNAHVIGVTGSPGAGKSTLVDGLVRIARSEGGSVAVLAVDPSSPFSGGAVLGDRIRMQSHASDPGVFIRSMGARGHLGGLAQATHDAVRVLDAAGYMLILVETVGVGQSELDIAAAADTTLVVVTPGMGDTVQTLKAGILEIADVFALNKADQEGAQQTLRALNSMLHMEMQRDWNAEIVETRANDGEGLAALWSALLRHRAYLEDSGELQVRRIKRLRGEVRELVESGLRTTIVPRLLAAAHWEAVVQAVADRSIDPSAGADEIIRHVASAAICVQEPSYRE